MPTTTTTCEICTRIRQIDAKTNPYFVAELTSGYVVIGDHQLCRGYSLFLCKEHKNELHELPTAAKLAFLEEMSLVAEAVFLAFAPNKMNYELLGNSIEHMHWHLFPRHADDIRPIGPVWVIDRSLRYADSARPSPDELHVLKHTLLEALRRTAGERISRSFLDDGM